MTQLADNQTASKGTALANGASIGWLENLRSTAAAHFAAVGYPTGKQEHWRHTNFAALAKIPWKPAPRSHAGDLIVQARRHSFGDEVACELVFVNGHYEPQLSRLGKLLRGMRVVSLAAAFPTAQGSEIQTRLAKYASSETSPFVALNTANIENGAYICVPAGIHMEAPIHLLFISTGDEGGPVMSHPRVLVHAQDNSEFSFVESYVGETAGGKSAGYNAGTYFTNAVTELIVGENCSVDHCKLQHETDEAFHVATMQVQLGRHSTFVTHNATIGAKLTRNDLNVVMAGEGAEATMNGLALLRGSMHCDNHTLLDHAKPNCPSHELYKHVLKDKSTGVFRGKILVRPDAQKTDSKQTSKSLLLSDDAYMNSQPALEIYADDVKCTHGSTTGPVDEEQVFYLRSRGVGEEAARHLLTYAFAADITRRIRVEPVRRRLEDHMAVAAGLPQDLRITDLGHHDEASR